MGLSRVISDKQRGDNSDPPSYDACNQTQDTNKKEQADDHHFAFRWVPPLSTRGSGARLAGAGRLRRRASPSRRAAGAGDQDKPDLPRAAGQPFGQVADPHGDGHVLAVEKPERSCDIGEPPAEALLPKDAAGLGGARRRADRRAQLDRAAHHECRPDRPVLCRIGEWAKPAQSLGGFRRSRNVGLRLSWPRRWRPRLSSTGARFTGWRPDDVDGAAHHARARARPAPDSLRRALATSRTAFRRAVDSAAGRFSAGGVAWWSGIRSRSRGEAIREPIISLCVGELIGYSAE